MASAKSSRSRASGAISASANPQENGEQLGDNLKVFKTENLDPDAHVQSKCQNMNEKVFQLDLALLLSALWDPTGHISYGYQLSDSLGDGFVLREEASFAGATVYTALDRMVREEQTCAFLEVISWTC